MSTPITPNAPFSPVCAASASGVVQRAIAGDAQAIAALVRIVRPSVLSVVGRIFGRDRADADDAVQLALIGFIQALPAYRGESEPIAYAKAIAVRAAIAVKRRSRAQASRHIDDADPADLTSEAPSPNDEVTAHRRRALVRQLLGEIPAEQAEALAMRIVLGWTLDEIATRANVPSNTVRSRIRLAKVALRAKIEAFPELLEALDANSTV